VDVQNTKNNKFVNDNFGFAYTLTFHTAKRIGFCACWALTVCTVHT